MMRLQRYVAHAGVASRRSAEELIARGSVRVNGTIVREPGCKVGEGDIVEIAGIGRAVPAALHYLVLHKPAAVVTTMHDPQGRRTIANLLPKEGPRIVPVGRLDYDTSGVLLLTNDGDLTHVLTHPRYGVEKTYRAFIRGRLAPSAVRALLSGVQLEDGLTAPAKVRVVAARRDGSIIDISLHEGRNRQVRRMFAAVGHTVQALVRMRFGPISLGELAPGATRELTARETSALRAIADAAEE
jgi:23S rRNA pseudouridine2605 synthase